MDNFLLVDANAAATEISGVLKIGRSKTNDLVLTDPLASRHHATIYLEGGVLMIRDEQSVNGTIVNGSQIYEPTMIQDRDTIQIGDELFTLRAPLSESRTVRASNEVPQPDSITETVSEASGEVLEAEDQGKAGVSYFQKNRTGLVIAGASLLILCVCCVVGYIVLSNMNLINF